jgi:hypothetical protein
VHQSREGRVRARDSHVEVVTMGQPLPKAYHPTAPMAPAFNAGLTGAGVGLFISAIQNSLLAAAGEC